MKNKNLNQIKKALIGVSTVVIVALAVVNVHFAMNGESIVNISLAGTESLANGEDPGSGGSGRCSTKMEAIHSSDEYLITYDCADGNGDQCIDGFEVWYYSNGGYYQCYSQQSSSFC